MLSFSRKHIQFKMPNPSFLKRKNVISGVRGHVPICGAAINSFQFWMKNENCLSSKSEQTYPRNAAARSGQFCASGHGMSKQILGKQYLFSHASRSKTLPKNEACGVACLAHPVPGVQNRYWVNTTRFVCAGRVVALLRSRSCTFLKEKRCGSCRKA